MLGNREQHEQVLELRDVAEKASTPLRRWEDALELPVALLILPLFALVNAGVEIIPEQFIESLKHSVGLGIICGLVLGKFIGISGACWLALRLKIGRLPEAVNIQHVVGVSLIAGIGLLCRHSLRHWVLMRKLIICIQLKPRYCSRRLFPLFWAWHIYVLWLEKINIWTELQSLPYLKKIWLFCVLTFAC